MKIYNLFPLLAGEFKAWDEHIERASTMGFDWIFVNPIQKPGASGSLYSIADYFQLNPLFVDKSARRKPDTQLKEVIKQAEKKYAVRMMIDLVINHCAIDSELVKQHPDWFLRNTKGKVEHPFCMEDGRKVVWHDLARFDHQHSADAKGQYNFFLKVIRHFINLGFKGFRCDAAYQLPSSLWRRLIEDIKKTHPEVVFTAETLGCTADQTKQTAQAGFDYVFNSSKWWDFSGPWLLEQYQLIREFVPSISFPESHDTERLYQESHNVDVLKQRYCFAALFSAGVMMPMGYEFGFKNPLHVVKTRSDDWETTNIDISAFISQVNQIKSANKVFQEDGPINMIGHENDAVLFLWKASNCCQQEALILLNKDPWNKQYFRVENLYHYVQSGESLSDLSIDYPLSYIPAPYEFELNPGMVRVMVTTRSK